jgi:biuret amidohydrolase
LPTWVLTSSMLKSRTAAIPCGNGFSVPGGRDSERRGSCRRRTEWRGALRVGDLPRVFIRLRSLMHGCPDLGPHARSLEATFGNILRQKEYEFLEELAPLPGEPVVTKLSASAITSSNIDALLRNLSLSTLVFAGVSTSQCVDLTARDAADRRYRCAIVQDAVAEDAADFHDATLNQFGRLFGAVVTTDEVLTSIAGTANGDSA